jgi:hypothetical protein
LGLGKFLIVEIPQLTMDLKNIDDTSLDADQLQLKSRLVRALENLEEIEVNIRKGEWGEAAEGCRTAMEPLAKGNISRSIKDMIIKTTGIEEKNALQLTMAFDNIFNYSSGLLHGITKDQNISNRYAGGKEDAYMDYMIITAIVNSVARKFVRTLKT